MHVLKAQATNAAGVRVPQTGPLGACRRWRCKPVTLACGSGRCADNILDHSRIIGSGGEDYPKTGKVGIEWREREAEYV